MSAQSPVYLPLVSASQLPPLGPSSPEEKYSGGQQERNLFWFISGKVWASIPLPFPKALLKRPAFSSLSPASVCSLDHYKDDR